MKTILRCTGLTVLISSLIFFFQPFVQAQEEIDTVQAEAEDGDAKAQNNLGVLYVKGEGVKRSAKEALTLNVALSRSALSLTTTIRAIDLLLVKVSAMLMAMLKVPAHWLHAQLSATPLIGVIVTRTVRHLLWPCLFSLTVVATGW